MQLILDKNFISETKEVKKEIKKSAVKYDGYTLKGERIELYDVESGKIAPIVRFLIEGKKSKLSWLIIFLIGFLLILFFGLMAYLFYPSEKEKKVTSVPIQSVTPVIKETEKETEIDENKIELLNEVDMMRELKNSAELETEKTLFSLEFEKLEREKLQLQVETLTQENEKLQLQVETLTQENELLRYREINSPADEFIYYLGDITYKKCEKPLDEEILRKCEKIYFNYLEYKK